MDPPDRAYWQRRQDALGIQVNRETLTPGEVIFCERFIQGHPGMTPAEVLEWIPRDPTMRPTNDFIWLARNGLICELKSPRIATSDQAVRLIRDAITKARKQDVVKENFIIDFGDQDVAERELARLAGYNSTQRTTQVSSIWVMIQGKLNELQLGM
jgi:hypothetical protein